MNAAPASPPRKILRDCLFLLLLATIPALLAGWFHPKRPVWSLTKPGVAEVDLREVSQWTPPIIWVDARTLSAYQTRHVPGAILLNEGEWERLLPGFLEVWQPNARIVVYCDSAACDASQTVALRLQRELKLSDINVLKGGWASWLKTKP